MSRGMEGREEEGTSEFSKDGRKKEGGLWRRKKVWEGVEEEKKEEMRRRGRQEKKNKKNINKFTQNRHVLCSCT